jgi:mono/diheme cytochrome c family protein
MRRVTLAVLAALALPIAVSAAGSAPPEKVTITLPGDVNFAFKPGPGADLAQIHCLGCHSSAYVSTQPPLDRAHWRAEAVKMRSAFKAPIPDAAIEPLTDYLVREYGPG